MHPVIQRMERIVAKQKALLDAEQPNSYERAQARLARAKENLQRLELTEADLAKLTTQQVQGITRGRGLTDAELSALDRHERDLKDEPSERYYVEAVIQQCVWDEAEYDKVLNQRGAYRKARKNETPTHELTQWVTYAKRPDGLYSGPQGPVTSLPDGAVPKSKASKAAIEACVSGRTSIRAKQEPPSEAKAKPALPLKGKAKSDEGEA